MCVISPIYMCAIIKHILLCEHTPYVLVVECIGASTTSSVYIPPHRRGTQKNTHLHIYAHEYAKTHTSTRRYAYSSLKLKDTLKISKGTCIQTCRMRERECASERARERERESAYLSVRRSVHVPSHINTHTHTPKP
jgi:hypothetical protein